MSNVLLGIVGVILFIGLALAGAYFLGPQFQKAYVNSKAVAVTQMTSQVMAASSLYRTDNGRPIVARQSVAGLESLGYLSTVPLNPYIDQGGFPFRTLYAGDLQSSGFYADIVMLDMGGSEDARAVCGALNRQTMGSEEIAELAIASGADISSMTSRSMGCFRMHDIGVPGEANPHDYIVFAQL